MEQLELKKRTSYFVMRPQSYCIKCDICGGTNLNWSEWDHLIWCYDCEQDTKGTGGIFDGPLPVKLAQMMGLSFDRFDMETKTVIEFKP